jgi:hypothetical protein
MAKFSMSAPGSFTETSTKSLMDQYRGIVATRYQPCSHTQILTTIKSSAFVVSRKFDGELWYLVTAGSGSKLVAANGRVITGAHPILDQAAKLPAGLLIAGELYVPAAKGRERVGDVSQALANAGASLSFAAFDLVSGPDGTFQDKPYQARLESIESAITASTELHVVSTKRMADPQDLVSYFDTEILANGYEGVVVRSDDGRAFKVKQERTVDAVVLGFTEREGASGSIETRSLLLGLKNEDEFILVGVAANAVTDFSRTEAHALLKSQVVESEYRHAASTGQVYQMVRPDVIVEVNVVDIQSTDSKGLPMKQPTLTYSENMWLAGKQVNAITLINAVATRFRTDKTVDSDGASWRQVEDVAPRVDSSATDLPESKIVRRQVWTKGTGDKVDVRKLVVWKTNKEQVDLTYPAYVVHWTDFSKGRKSPLDREVRPAPSEAAALALADQMIEDNIKKGWTEVE